MNITNAIIGALWFIVALVMNVLIWSWITELSSLIEDDFFKALYWMAFIVLDVIISILAPIYIINQE